MLRHPVSSVHSMRSGSSVPSAVDRSTEITTAAHLMGFLPAFPHLPIDEVLGLRDEIKGPVVRFRGEVATIAKAFESRAIDEDFDIEVEDAWRMTVAPSLEDIREALAEHGLPQGSRFSRERRLSEAAHRSWWRVRRSTRSRCQHLERHCRRRSSLASSSRRRNEGREGLAASEAGGPT